MQGSHRILHPQPCISISLWEMFNSLKHITFFQSRPLTRLFCHLCYKSRNSKIHIVGLSPLFNSIKELSQKFYCCILSFLRSYVVDSLQKFEGVQMIRKGLEGIPIPEYFRVWLVQFGDNLPEDLINLCTRRTYMTKNIQVGSYTISTWTSESADSSTSPG